MEFITFIYLYLPRCSSCLLWHEKIRQWLDLNPGPLVPLSATLLARFLTGKSLLDKIPTSDIFKELMIPSVNQISAQIKLLQVWKSKQSSTFPTQWESKNEVSQERRTRSDKENPLMETTGGQIITSTFVSDAARLWNSAPDSIKSSTSLHMAKKNIKEFSLTLPI